ncbi:MAG: hypothetical protein AB2L07_20085 [Thermoanaerobaculaceae bacterium]
MRTRTSWDCGAYMYYAWDEDEHVITRGRLCGPVPPCLEIDIDPNEMPFVTQKVPLSHASFDLPAVAGWMMLILPPSYAGFTEDPTPGPELEVPALPGRGGRADREVARCHLAEAAVVGNAQCQAGGAR